MADCGIKFVGKITCHADITLTETEARALVVLTEYGTDTFLKHFYTFLGRHYLEPHEKGIVSLFEKIRTELPLQLRAVDEARSLLKSALLEREKAAKK